MADASDYLASSLVNPDEEVEQGIQAQVEQRRQSGYPMSPEEVETLRSFYLGPHSPAAREQLIAEDPASHRRTFPPRERPDFRGAGTMSQYVEPRAVSEAAENIVRTEPTLEEVMAQPAAQTPSPAPDVAPVVTGSEPTRTPPSRIRAVKAPDGRTIFTNVPVGEEGVPGGEEMDYREAVSGFRDKMGAHQAGLGAPPPDRTNLQGGVSPGGHMLGVPDAPLPGDVGAPGVSVMGTVAPTDRALEEGEWEGMTPGAQLAYTQQVADRAQGEQMRAQGELAEHGARLATDPGYRAEQRTYLRDRYEKEALQDQGVQAEIAQTIAAFREVNPNLPEDSPEWIRMITAAQQQRVEAYLQKKYQSVAPWDDELSRNAGLVIS